MDNLGRRTVLILSICVIGGIIGGALALGQGADPQLAAIVAGMTGLTMLVLIFLLMWRP